MLKRVSIFWVLLVALLITSALPVAYIAFFEVATANQEFKEAAISKLRSQNQSQALIFNEQLEEFRLTTDLLSRNLHQLYLTNEFNQMPPQEVERRTAKYSVQKTTGLFGLDDWYEDVFLTNLPPAREGEDVPSVSNVFVEGGGDPNAEQMYTIALTEDLNPFMVTLGASLDQSTYIGTHNVIVITVNGVMRQFPYVPSEATPDIPFDELDDFVEAGPDENPSRGPVWSVPYVDFDRDGRLFVVNMVPVYDQDEYVAVIAHDLDLSVLSSAVRDIQVGSKGQAFIVDRDGVVIVHPEFNPTAAWLNLSREEQSTILEDEDDALNWLEQNVDILPEDIYPQFDDVIQDIMAADVEAPDHFAQFEHNDETWVVASHLIPETDWHLIYIQPEKELLSTATEVSNEVQRATAITLGLVIFAAILLARRITSPVVQLSNTAHAIEKSVDEETSDLISQNLEQLGNVTSVMEINNLARVFEQMVMALHNRMVELNSIYAMGQTITANVEYASTLQSILDAVRQVVICDAAEVVIKRHNGLIVEGWSGETDYHDTTGHIYGAGEIRSHIQTSDVLFVPDVPAGSSYDTELEQHNVRSLLVIPLKFEDRLLGALVMAHHQPNAFTEDIKRQLTKLSAQAAIAIDNAIKVKEREDSLKQKITELKVAIDQTQRDTQVGEISESDFFKDLQAKTAKLRKRMEQNQQQESSETDE